MDQPNDAANPIEEATKTTSSVYVPSVERTAGQPPPFAANGGLSYIDRKSVV